ncbi:HEAT repeat domain-containing protein [Patescibacteria group bacterium]
MKGIIKIKQKHIEILFVVVVFLVFSLLMLEKNIFSETSENIKTELKEEHESLVNQLKIELPLLVNELKSGNSEQRIKAARRLGFSEDSRAIIPLAEIVIKDEDSSVKCVAVSSLLNISYRGDKIPNFYIFLEEQIIPALKKTIENDEEIVQKTVAEALYRLGEKDIALPVIESIALLGDIGILNTFFYIPELSKENVLVNTVLPDRLTDPLVKTEKKVDEYSYLSLLKILDFSPKSSVKIVVAEIIFNYKIKEKNYLIPYLKDIVINSEDIDSRIKSMSLLYKIDTVESKEVLLKASEIDEIKSYATHYLNYSKKNK